MKSKDSSLCVPEAIQEFKNRPTNQEIFRRFSTKTFFDIVKGSRKENIHTNFLAWLFEQDWHIPISENQIVNLLRIAHKRVIRDEHRLHPSIVRIVEAPEKIGGICVSECHTEYVCRMEHSKDGRADIVIKAEIIHDGIGTPITIVLENKINSKEHDGQTCLYYSYFSGKYEEVKKKSKKKRVTKYDRKENECQVFLYLSAHSNKQIDNIFIQDLKSETCECPYFIHINYQDIMVYILDPLLDLLKIQNDPRAIYIEDYIKCLSLPYFESETKSYYNTIAISMKDKELLKVFWEENSAMIRAALDAFADCSDEPDAVELKENIDRFYAIRYSSDYAISYNGNSYGPYKKRWLALNICKILADHGNFISPADCPCKDYNGRNAILSDQEYHELVNSGPSYKDRFTQLSNPNNSNDCIYISNQWGIKNGVDPIDDIKEWAKKYDIIVK